MPSTFRNAGDSWPSSDRVSDSVKRTRRVIGLDNLVTHVFRRPPRRMQTSASVAQKHHVMGVCGGGETLDSSCTGSDGQESEMNTQPVELSHSTLSSSTLSGQSLSSQGTGHPDRSNASSRASQFSHTNLRSHRTMENIVRRTSTRTRAKRQAKQARQNGAAPLVEVDISIRIGRAETDSTPVGGSSSMTATTTDMSSTSATDIPSSTSSTNTSAPPTSTTAPPTSTTESSTSTMESSTISTESSTNVSSSSTTESSSATSNSSTISESMSNSRSESSASSSVSSRSSQSPSSSTSISSSSTSISASTTSSFSSPSSTLPSSVSQIPSSSRAPTSSIATTHLTTSTFVSFTTFFTTIPPTDPPISITSTTTTTSSGILNTNRPDSNSRFAQNKGAIIGVSIGGVVFVIVAVVILFFLCSRWRRRRRATPPPDGDIGGAGSLQRDRTIGSGSRRMLMRNHSSGASTWRPPLSDEDVEDAPPQLTQTPSTLMAIGGGYGSHGHSSSGDSLAMRTSLSNSGHGHPEEIIPVPPLPVTRRSSLNQHPQMPGFGQAAEHMSSVSPTSPNSTSALLSSSSPTFLSKTASPTSPPSAYLLYTSSRTSHDHGSSTHEHDGAASSSLHHTNTMMSAASSSSGSHSHSHSTPHSHGHYVPSRVRIREDPPPTRKESASSFKGLISRLRGGARTSSDDTTNSSGNRSTPREGSSNPSALSFSYPPTAGPSSLLNPPPLPTVKVTQETVGIPIPPSPTEDSSSIRVTEGLLDPHLVERERDGMLGMSATGAGGSKVSVGSLRDNVDYSRPYRGFVFNRMGSSATFATQTTVGGRTPGPTDTPRLTGARIDEEEDYFGRGIAM